MSVQTIMKDDPSGAGLVDFARQTALALVKENLTRTQIRNTFTEVRKIESLWSQDKEKALRRLNMLKPKLAYQAQRERRLERLRDVLTEAIDVVEKAKDQDEAFQRFVELFEAILAYHKAEGGRN